MKNNENKYFFGMQSWLLSILASFIVMILFFFIDGFIGAIPGVDKNMGEGIGYILYAVIISVIAFFICRNNPDSIWYVPILINSAGIISAIFEPNFWITDLWIFIGSGWVLSLIGAAAGAGIGRRAKSELIAKQ